MKNWILVTIIAILAIGLVNGALYLQSNSNLQSAQIDMIRMKQDISAISSTVSNLQTQIADASSTVGGHMASVTDTVAKVTPAIVRVDVTGANFQASGSGSIIDNRGYVLTNYHVIERAITIKVTVFRMAVFDGTVVASNQTRDLSD